MAFDYNPSDDSIIISSRHQSAVVKIGRDKKIKWIKKKGGGCIKDGIKNFKNFIAACR
ncbi:hypothetical protein ELQ17_00250 [Campylobacter sp. US18a]|nr:hypothetical protein ELQ17_00250 [Campylobacter sp. US18a]